mgnify:CR=1 FL=1
MCKEDVMTRFPFREVFLNGMSCHLFVFFYDTRYVRTGAMCSTIGVKEVIDGLHIEANALDVMLYEPLSTFNGESGRISEVIFVLAPSSVCTCIKEYPISFFDSLRNLFSSFFDILYSDEFPLSLGDVQANCFSKVILDRKFMRERRFRRITCAGESAWVELCIWNELKVWSSL